MPGESLWISFAYPNSNSHSNSNSYSYGHGDCYGDRLTNSQSNSYSNSDRHTITDAVRRKM